MPYPRHSGSLYAEGHIHPQSIFLFYGLIAIVEKIKWQSLEQQTSMTWMPPSSRGNRIPRPHFVRCRLPPSIEPPSLLLHPSIVVFSSSFPPLEFPLIIVITVVIHRLSPVRRRHLSPPSPVQQYLIVVSSSSVVYHIVFIVVVMLHIVIVASSLLLAGSHHPLPNAGWFLFVRYSHCRRSVVGKHHPQLAVIVVRHSLSSLLTAHAHRRPHAFGWTVGEGARGRKYPMHCLIVVIVFVHHPLSPSSVSVVNRPLSTVASYHHLSLILLNIVATSGLNG